MDLKLVQWGTKGSDAQKYASTVPGDLIQSFRNFVTGSLAANNRFWSKRDVILILLDEFDVIASKN